MYNNYACLADKTLFPADKSRKRFSVRILIVVFRLIGDSDNRRSIVFSQILGDR
jgi:hypothetical protein